MSTERLMLPGAAPGSSRVPAPQQADLRAAFDAFVGETFYGQMLQAMRRSLGEPAYFHGGRAERIFQQQLDQTLGEKMARADAGSFTGAMYELQFLLQRS